MKIRSVTWCFSCKDGIMGWSGPHDKKPFRYSRLLCQECGSESRVLLEGVAAGNIEYIKRLNPLHQA